MAARGPKHPISERVASLSDEELVAMLRHPSTALSDDDRQAIEAELLSRDESPPRQASGESIEGTGDVELDPGSEQSEQAVERTPLGLAIAVSAALTVFGFLIWLSSLR